MRNRWVWVTTLLVFPFFSVRSEEGEKGKLTAGEMVHKANLVAYYAGADGRSSVDMTITDAQGRSRKRRMTIIRKNVVEGGDQKFFVYFHRPADVRNMTYLVWKHPGGDDDRWLYQPSLDLLKRIAASDKRTSFVGSHFLYEDISGRGEEEDEHELLSEDEKFYVIRNRPKDAKGVEFDHYDVWIDKETFIPMKAEYTDRGGNKYRLIEALKVEEIDGHPTVTKSKATDLASGGSTVSTFSKVKYDIGVPDAVFTERSLRNPPRKWLR